MLGVEFVSLDNNAACGSMTNAAFIHQCNVHCIDFQKIDVYFVLLHYFEFTILHNLPTAGSFCRVKFMNPALWVCQLLRHRKWFSFHLLGRQTSPNLPEPRISLCLSTTTTTTTTTGRPTSPNLPAPHKSLSLFNHNKPTTTSWLDGWTSSCIVVENMKMDEWLKADEDLSLSWW